MKSLKIAMMLVSAILLGGCGGKTPEGILGNNLIEIRGTATVTGVLELPAAGMAKTAAISSACETAAGTGSVSGVARPFVPGLPDFTIQCGDASCTPDSSGAWTLKGIKPGKKIRIRAFCGNIELMMKIDELFPNQILAGTAVGSRSTATALLNEQLESAMPGMDTEPLPEDILALAVNIESAIVNGRHMLGRLTELPETADSVRATIEKMKRNGRQGVSKGAIDVWRLTDKFPEAVKFDANGDGFLSDEEFRAMKRYLSLLIPETVSSSGAGQGSSAIPGIPGNPKTPGFAGEPAVAVSAVASLSEETASFDSDDDSLLTETEAAGLFKKISSLIQSLPGRINADVTTMVQLLPADWTSDPRKAGLTVACVFASSPWLFEAQTESDPAIFDAKLAGFIAGLPSLTSRECAKSFSMGILENKVDAQSAPTATLVEQTGSVKISVPELLGRYPGCATLDGDGDGFLTCGELEILRYLIAPVTGSNLAIPGQDPDDVVLRSFRAPVTKVAACLGDAESHDRNANGFLEIDELNQLLRLLKSLFIMIR